MLNGVMPEIAHAFDAEFDLHAGVVGLDRVGADAECGRDLARARAFAEEMADFSLLITQLVTE